MMGNRLIVGETRYNWRNCWERVWFHIYLFILLMLGVGWGAHKWIVGARSDVKGFMWYCADDLDVLIQWV